MKKGFILITLFSCLFSLAACASFRTKSPSLSVWPSKITSLQGVAELTVLWKDIKHSGEISIALQYPDVLSVDLYGPFGDTAFTLKRTGDSFTLRHGSRVETDERKFYELFHITTDDFLRDITMHGPVRTGADGTLRMEREAYTVIYSINENENKICWVSPDGKLCIKFLEVAFNGERDIEDKNRDRGM